jgi:hypothetical protein
MGVTKSSAGDLRLQIAGLKARLEEAEVECDGLAEENDLLSEQLDEIFKIAAPEGAIDDDDDLSATRVRANGAYGTWPFVRAGEEISDLRMGTCVRYTNRPFSKPGKCKHSKLKFPEH